MKKFAKLINKFLNFFIGQLIGTDAVIEFINLSEYFFADKEISYIIMIKFNCTVLGIVFPITAQSKASLCQIFDIFISAIFLSNSSYYLLNLGIFQKKYAFRFRIVFIHFIGNFFINLIYGFFVFTYTVFLLNSTVYFIIRCF